MLSDVKSKFKIARTKTGFVNLHKLISMPNLDYIYKAKIKNTNKSVILRIEQYRWLNFRAELEVDPEFNFPLSVDIIVKGDKKPKLYLKNLDTDNCSYQLLNKMFNLVNKFENSKTFLNYLHKNWKELKHDYDIVKSRANITKICDKKGNFIDPNVVKVMNDSNGGYSKTSYSSQEDQANNSGKIDVTTLSDILYMDGFDFAGGIVRGIYDKVAYDYYLKDNPDAIRHYALSGASVGCSDLDVSKNDPKKIVKVLYNYDTNKREEHPVSKKTILEYAEGNLWNDRMVVTFDFTKNKSIAEEYDDYTKYDDNALNLHGYVFWN